MRIGEKEYRFRLGGSYKYKSKPVTFKGYTYEKKPSQHRAYCKQADEWMVRGHYRVYKSGLRVFVKGYKKEWGE